MSFSFESLEGEIKMLGLLADKDMTDEEIKEEIFKEAFKRLTEKPVDDENLDEAEKSLKIKLREMVDKRYDKQKL